MTLENMAMGKCSHEKERPNRKNKESGETICRKKTDGT